MQAMMNVGDIAFPHLGIYLENVPKNFTVFGFTIAFYGVIIGFGVLAGLLLAVRNARMTGQNPEDYWDFALYAIIFSIIGARVYYVVFEWENYKDDLLSIFNTRRGGLAIYGAVIGAFTTLFLYCKIKKRNPFQMGDTAVPGLILGQVIGRWGNFMNREAFGQYTDNLFAMRLPIEAVRHSDISQGIADHILEGTNYIQVHPTFLYESVWNLVLFTLMMFFLRRKKFHGEICLLYFGGYGLGRFLIESLRTDQLKIPGTNLAVSQLLSLCLVLASIVTLILVRKQVSKGRLGMLCLDRGIYMASADEGGPAEKGASVDEGGPAEKGASADEGGPAEKGASADEADPADKIQDKH